MSGEEISSQVHPNEEDEEILLDTADQNQHDSSLSIKKPSRKKRCVRKGPIELVEQEQEAGDPNRSNLSNSADEHIQNTTA